MYTVNRIRLKKFTGMHLNEVEEFDLTIQSAITILLGRNGCGKTRLVNVVIPTCPDKTDFRDGGSYINDSTLDGVDYQFKVKRVGSHLKCSIKNVTASQVIVKDVNPKVYNAKVEDILGVTPAVKDLLIGNPDVTLCRLSTGARRNWFTKLSTSDLTYALGVHKKLKDYSRDLVGAIKHGQAKIAEIKPRVVECAKEREMLGGHIQTLKAEVEELGAKIREITVNPNIDKSKYVNTLDNLDRVSMAISKMPRLGNTVIGDIEKEIAEVRSRIGESRARHEHSQQHLGTLLEQKQRYSYLLKNSDGLADQVRELAEWLGAKGEDELAFKKLRDFDLFTLSDLTTAMNYLGEFSVDLTRAIDGRVTASTYPQLQDAVKKQRDKRIDVETKISQVTVALQERQHRLEHFLGTNAVDCPKCATTFKPGLANVDEKSLVKDIDDLEKVLATGNAKLVELVAEGESLTTEFELAGTIRELGMSYSKDPVLAVMFAHLHAEDAFNKNRDKFGGIVSWFVDELETAIDVCKEHNNWLTKSAKLREVTAGTEINFEELVADIAAAEKVCEFQKSTLDTHNNNLSVLTLHAKQLSEMKVLEVDYRKLLDDAVKQEGEWMLNEYKAALASKRQEVFDNYSMANTRFNEMDEEYRRLEAIESEVELLQKRQDVAVKLVRAMSPEKGLLRKYFYRAIARITDMMNKHIATIWEYPLEVHPCNIEEGDMDYKFPFHCGTNDEPAPDVKFGSAAQREIFNLVYQLTAFKALGLEGFPIILDEPGHTFDEGHRNRLVDFIKALLDANHHSQAIVISHNSDVHSRLNSADFVVLDEDGITPPAIYNERVKIVTRG